MKLSSKAVICGLAVAAITAVGCSSNMSKGTGTNPGKENVGEIGLNVTLPGGQTLTSLAYTLTNAGTPADGSTGTIPLGTGAVTFPFAVPTFEILPVPTANGYSLTVSGAAGGVTCTGTTGPFNVTAGNETVVNILVTCTTTADSGSVEINTTLQACPTISTLTAINATANITAPGNTSNIFASAVAPNQAGLTYSFAVTSGTGTLSGQTTAAGNANSSIPFTCPTVGQADVITVTTTDQTGATCGTLGVATVTVTCGSPACAGVGTSTEATPNSAAGTCPAGQSNSLKDSAGNFCCAAIPCFGIPTAGTAGTEATPDTSAGTCPAPLANQGVKDSAGNFCCTPVVLLPCTTAGQTNCVQCQGNSTGICSPTEAAFVQYDITNKVATAAGPDPAAGCYSCLEGGGCIDDTQFTDTGHECEDTNAFTSGTSSQCEAVISCILGSGVGSTSCAFGADATCYCGTAPVATNCQGNPAVGPINGVCDTVIAAGLGFPVTDGTDNTANFTNTTLPSGRADQIFQCAHSNSCAACL
jgi:hypothetical protein